MALPSKLPTETYDQHVVRLRIHTLDALMPEFRGRVDLALEDLTLNGLDAIVFETGRTDELAKLYYEHGVSKAKDALHTYHHYGLAVDVISKAKEWGHWEGTAEYDLYWRTNVCDAFAQRGCDWGGNWTTFKDLPHFQMGGLPGAPPLALITAFQSGGTPAAWDWVRKELKL